jgi:hypothetical protein
MFLKRIEPHTEAFLLEFEVCLCLHSDSDYDSDYSQSTESTLEEIAVFLLRYSDDRSIRKRQDDV